MKRYQQDPDAPSHVLTLLESARVDELDAARRKRVAARLGLLPLLVVTPGLAAGGGSGAASGSLIASGGGAVGRTAGRSAASLLRPRLSFATIAGAVALIGAVSALALVAFARDPQPAAFVVATASPVEPIAPAPKETLPVAEPMPPSMSVTALPEVTAHARDVVAAPTVHTTASAASVAQWRPPAARAAETSDLHAELVALEAVRAATTAGRPREALRQLDHYDATFPAGKLREEAAVLRIEALAERGDSVAARAAADQFLHDSPNTVYAARVRAASLRASREPAQ
jgi:hypothetical protein